MVKNKKYKVVEAFVQCDYLDGFKYIDKAGEIVNKFVHDNREVPQFTMGLNGMKLTNVSDTVKELKISSNSLWIHFVEPTSLDEMAKVSSQIFQDIFDIINPTMYERVGWRVFFKRDIADKMRPANNLRISKGFGAFEFEKLIGKRSMQDFDLRLEVSPLANPTNPSQFSLLFDVDIAKKDEDMGLDPVNLIDDMNIVLKSDQLMGSLEELVK